MRNNFVTELLSTKCSVRKTSIENACISSVDLLSTRICKIKNMQYVKRNVTRGIIGDEKIGRESELI